MLSCKLKCPLEQLHFTPCVQFTPSCVFSCIYWLYLKNPPELEVFDGVCKKQPPKLQPSFWNAAQMIFIELKLNECS